jgi:hypothetical protein
VAYVVLTRGRVYEAVLSFAKPVENGLTEDPNIGTVWVARAGARIGVIGGKGKGGIRAPVASIHTADRRISKGI